MKNKVQLITYVDRMGMGGIQALHHLLKTEFAGVFDGGIHLLPFYFPVDGSDAGYDPIDHTIVDQRLGDWGDIAALAEDYDLMGDIIVNHVSDASPQFKDVIEKGSQSPYFGMFLTKDKVFAEGASEEEIKRIYRPRPSQPFTTMSLANGETMDFWTTFTQHQVDIDVSHPHAVAYLDSILTAFAESGIKLIRLDAAGYAKKKRGTSCFMIPETYAFMSEFAQKANDLGIEVLVEIHSHYLEQIKIAERVDYVYDFALPALVLHTFEAQNTQKLKHWLDISPRNCFTVLDTHDGIGVVDVAADGDRPGILSDGEVDRLVEFIHANSGGVSRKATGAAASNLDLYQVNCTYYEALGKNDLHYLMARAIQFFCPGTPQVYYTGFLAGENDVALLEKTKVGRDINRPYYSKAQILHRKRHPIVEDLVELARFRNTHPSFQGDFSLAQSSDTTLIIRWENGLDWSSLEIDLAQMRISIGHSGSSPIQLQTLANS